MTNFMYLPANRFLKVEELRQAEATRRVWDKNGNKYFKLADGFWASEMLTTVTSEELAKSRVRLYGEN